MYSDVNLSKYTHRFTGYKIIHMIFYILLVFLWLASYKEHLKVFSLKKISHEDIS